MVRSEVGKWRGGREPLRLDDPAAFAADGLEAEGTPTDRHEDGPPPCPFCGFADSTCGHLLVAADRTFMEFHGPEFERHVGPAEELLQRAVGPCLARLARLPPARRNHLVAAIQPPRLRALLRDTLEGWPEPPEEDDDTVLEDGPRWDYVEEILLSAGDTVGLPWDFEGTPGQPSQMIDFWSSDPAGSAREARRLILEDVAALDRLLA
jgi:hypothetical protein